MKKTVSIILVILMHISLVALIGFDKQISNIGKADIPLFGLGITASYGESKNAGEEDGQVQVTVNTAAVLLDYNGKIVKCELDCADSKVKFSQDGKLTSSAEFLTKRELGDNYNMVAWGGAALEWYAQADAFEKICEGKTIDEVKALVVDGYKGTDEVINAGCTIGIADFVASIEEAVNNAKESKATFDDTLNLGIVTSVALKDPAEDNYSFDVNTTVVAACVGADGKVSVASTDAISITAMTDRAGKIISDTTAEIKTKKSLGFDYKMSEYGIYNDFNGDGIVKEWFEQAKEFDTALAGKNATEIAALAVNTGYGSEALQAAGCTIHIGDMVKAAIKAATI